MHLVIFYDYFSRYNCQKVDCLGLLLCIVLERYTFMFFPMKSAEEPTHPGEAPDQQKSDTQCLVSDDKPLLK